MNRLFDGQLVEMLTILDSAKSLYHFSKTEHGKMNHTEVVS